MTEPGSPAGGYLVGVDVGTGSARAGVFTTDGRLVGTDKHPIAIHRQGGVMVEQSSEDIWRAVARSVRGAVVGGRRVARADPGPRLRRDLLAGRPRPGRRSAARRRRRPSRTQHHGLDGPPRGRTGRKDQRHGTPRAGVHRRPRLSRDGDAQAALAQGEPAGDLRARLAVHGPDRLPDLARHRRPGPLDLHGHLQVDLHGARAKLGPQLFRDRRSGRACRGRLRPDRQGSGRCRNRARRRADGRGGSRDLACSRERPSPPA